MAAGRSRPPPPSQKGVSARDSSPRRSALILTMPTKRGRRVDARVRKADVLKIDM